MFEIINHEGEAFWVYNLKPWKNSAYTMVCQALFPYSNMTRLCPRFWLAKTQKFAL